MTYFSWFALKSIPLVGNITFRRLIEHFGSPARVLAAAPQELALVQGISPAAIVSLCNFDYHDLATRECEAVEKHGVSIVTFLSAEYPRVLREITDAPPFLYVKGTLRPHETAIAVIGSRRASTYGRLTTERLAEDLAQHGIAVISGLARGIDTAAHKGALRGNGRTIGVLGCGVDLQYPPENRALFDEISEAGAIVSEFPLGTLPLAENFPRRNRIISGMAEGVLVVEAAEKSGSLITVQYALEQGREIFAVPGNINSPISRGTNQLIKQGAKLVEDVTDILEELQMPVHDKKDTVITPAFSLPPEETIIYGLLADAPQHIDELIVKSALTVGEVSAILLRLELKGAIMQLPGKNFART